MVAAHSHIDPTAGLACKYDAWNRLVLAENGETDLAKYEYDGLNRRTIEVPIWSTTYYHHCFWNAAWQLLELRVTTTPNTQPESLSAYHQHIWSPRYIDAPVFREKVSNGQRFYYLGDANFNVTTLIDSDGDAREHYQYDPYGVATILNGGTPDSDGDEWTADPNNASDVYNQYLYTGRKLDFKTFFYYYRIRYYTAELARFTGRDPIGYNAGDPNLYRYVGNMPVGFTDPYGLIDCESIAKDALQNLLAPIILPRQLQAIPPRLIRPAGEWIIDQNVGFVRDLWGGAMAHNEQVVHQWRLVGRGRLLQVPKEHLAFMLGFRSEDSLFPMAVDTLPGVPSGVAFSVSPYLQQAMGDAARHISPDSAARGARAAPFYNTLEMTAAALAGGLGARGGAARGARPRPGAASSRLSGAADDALGQVDNAMLERLRLGAEIEIPTGTAGIRRMMSDLSILSGNEVALVRTASGRRLLVMGGPNTTVLPANTTRVIAHTHPSGSLRLSGADLRVLNNPLRQNQRSTVLISPREDFGVRVPIPRP